MVMLRLNVAFKVILLFLVPSLLYVCNIWLRPTLSFSPVQHSTGMP